MFYHRKKQKYIGRGVPPHPNSIGKRPIYFRFFLLKASLNLKEERDPKTRLLNQLKLRPFHVLGYCVHHVTTKQAGALATSIITVPTVCCNIDLVQLYSLLPRKYRPQHNWLSKYGDEIYKL